MFKVFRAQDFINLPPLSEAGTLTLVDELESAAKATAHVPSGIFGALGRVLEATDELKRAIAARERSGSAADPRARAADRALDDAWGALQSWLLGWTLLPDRAHTRLKDARALYATLFPKGLQFLTLDFKNEWKESQERLAHIAKEGLDSVIDALGGAAFLATIARAHRAYGEALHIAPSGEADTDLEPDMRVQEALTTTHLALRDYVAHVAATVSRQDAASVAVAAALLTPLSDRELAPSTWDDDDDDVTEVTRKDTDP